MEDDPNYLCFADIALAVLRYIGIATAFAAAVILGCIIGLLLT